MKKIITSISLWAAGIAGFTMAYGFAPKRFLNLVYCIRSSGNLIYTNTVPGPTVTCQRWAPYACTLSTTATAGFFNVNFHTSFPAESSTPGAPEVTYLNPDFMYR